MDNPKATGTSPSASSRVVDNPLLLETVMGTLGVSDLLSCARISTGFNDAATRNLYRHAALVVEHGSDHFGNNPHRPRNDYKLPDALKQRAKVLTMIPHTFCTFHDPDPAQAFCGQLLEDISAGPHIPGLRNKRLCRDCAIASNKVLCFDCSEKLRLMSPSPNVQTLVLVGTDVTFLPDRAGYWDTGDEEGWGDEEDEFDIDYLRRNFDRFHFCPAFYLVQPHHVVVRFGEDWAWFKALDQLLKLSRSKCWGSVKRVSCVVGAGREDSGFLSFGNTVDTLRLEFLSADVEIRIVALDERPSPLTIEEMAEFAWGRHRKIDFYYLIPLSRAERAKTLFVANKLFQEAAVEVWNANPESGARWGVSDEAGVRSTVEQMIKFKDLDDFLELDWEGIMEVDEMAKLRAEWARMA